MRKRTAHAPKCQETENAPGKTPIKVHVREVGPHCRMYHISCGCNASCVLRIWITYSDARCYFPDVIISIYSLLDSCGGETARRITQNYAGGLRVVADARC